MNILHIANSYGGTTVYTNLYTAIDTNSDTVQWVYVPLNSRNHDRVGNKMIDFKNEGSRIHYSTLLKSYHKYLYGMRIRTIVRDVEKTFDMKKVDVIHAGTLCLDGAIAYELHKKYGIPYIVAVRTTDNGYYKMKWRHEYFNNILQKASKIVFVSPKFKEVFTKTHVSKSIETHIEQKVIVLPNGVDAYFLENNNQDHLVYNGVFQLLFAAAFIKRKGLIETILAIEKLREKGYQIVLNAVGKGLPNRTHDDEYIAQVEALANGKEWIKIQSFKPLPELVMEMRKANAFIMASKSETFGLVYIEALTQRLPVVYGQGEGFDGFYPDGFVGYSAHPMDVDSIAESIEKLIVNYTTICKNVESLDLDKYFDWNNISKRYITIYSSIV